MLYVCPWHEVEVHAADLGVTHLISLLGVEGTPDTPAGVAPERHLYVEVDDIAAPVGGYIAPDVEHVEEMIAFIRDWNRGGPLIIHCYAGISRSMAGALSAMCMFNPGREADAARILRQRAPHALPNRRIVEIADRLLGLEGRMVDAVAALGPREHDTYVGRLVELPVHLP